MEKNQLKIGIILSYLSIFMGSLVSIVYTPFLIRMLGKSEYGLYNLVYSVVSYLGLLSFGFGSAYMKFYTRYKVKNDTKNIAKLNGMFLTIFLILSFVALLAGTILINNVELFFSGGLSSIEIVKAKYLMIFLVINIAISFPTSVFDANIIANEKYFFQRGLQLVRTIATPLLTIPLLFLGYKSISLVVVHTLVALLNLGVNIFYCKKDLQISFDFKGFDKNVFKEISCFSSFIFINMITDQINWSVDKVILGKYVGAVGVAIYSVGAQINNYYMSFSTSISSVFIPRVNKIVSTSNDNHKLTMLMTKVGRIQCIILSYVLGGFLLLGNFFIKIWAGPGYGRESYIISLLLIIPVTIPCIQNVGIEIQRAKNMHKFRSIVYFLIAVCNIFISIPLCIKYGVKGAAVGTALNLIIGNGVLMNWYYWKRVHLDMIYYWKNVIGLFIPMGVATLLLSLVKEWIPINNIWKFLLYGILYSIIFGGLLWKKYLNEFEKSVLRSLICKIKKRNEYE